MKKTKLLHTTTTPSMSVSSSSLFLLFRLFQSFRTISCFLSSSVSSFLSSSLVSQCSCLQCSRQTTGNASDKIQRVHQYIVPTHFVRVHQQETHTHSSMCNAYKNPTRMNFFFFVFSAFHGNTFMSALLRSVCALMSLFLC